MKVKRYSMPSINAYEDYKAVEDEDGEYVLASVFEAVYTLAKEMAGLLAANSDLCSSPGCGVCRPDNEALTKWKEFAND